MGTASAAAAAVPVPKYAGGEADVKMVDSQGNELFSRGFGTIAATIADGQSLSGEIDLEGFVMLGMIMPAAWTAAVITFAVSDVAGGTYVPLYDDVGQEVTVQADASRALGLEGIAASLAPWRFLKLRSGTSGSAVNQDDDRAIKLIVKG